MFRAPLFGGVRQLCSATLLCVSLAECRANFSVFGTFELLLEERKECIHVGCEIEDNLIKPRAACKTLNGF